MKINYFFNLGVYTHTQTEFVLIDTIDDTEVFIDPSKIIALAGVNRWCSEAMEYLNSFIGELSKAYDNNDFDKFKHLCSHSSERNELNLGYKKKSKYGKGITPSELALLFWKFFDDCSNSNVEIQSLSLLSLNENFAEDKTTDLLSNILFKLLADFTEEQCEKFEIEQYLIEDEVYCWSIEDADWVETRVKSLSANGKKLILTPKNIVSDAYVLTAGKFFRQYINSLKKRESNKDLTTSEVLDKEYGIHNVKNIIKNNHYNEFSDYYNYEICEIQNGKFKMTDEKLDNLTKNKIDYSVS